eukprot:4498735-Pleurochrysis_carterae.AAC.1
MHARTCARATCALHAASNARIRVYAHAHAYTSTSFHWRTNACARAQNNYTKGAHSSYTNVRARTTSIARVPTLESACVLADARTRTKA